jgi:hypothetical protein
MSEVFIPDPELVNRLIAVHADFDSDIGAVHCAHRRFHLRYSDPSSASAKH